MLGIFNKGTENKSRDVKGLREAFLQFIKEELQKVEGGEGRYIKGLNIFIACLDDEKHLYESAIYLEKPELFKNEVQKIADDFAIDLPATWAIEVSFVETLPSEAKVIPDIDAALFIQTRKNTIQKLTTAYIRILSGEAENEEYVITSELSKITIGRDKKVQVNNGSFRLNTIAFPSDSNNENNKFVSRQHAHIEWEAESNHFILFADEGGIPPANKVKVKSSDTENLIKLNSTYIGHRLQENDQIILGESIVLEFSYLKQEA